MSIVVFAVQQGKLISAHAKNRDVPNLCVRNTELLKVLYCVPSVAESGTYVCHSGVCIWVIHTRWGLYTIQYLR